MEGNEDNVVTASFGGAPFRACADMYDELHAVVMQYEDRVGLMEVLGVLELLKHNLLSSAMERVEG